MVATAGIYSLEMTVPGGAAVPRAGVTWVTVSPTHRRRGVLTAIMRRQLDEVHAAGARAARRAVGRRGAIYGRFGYAPGDLARRLDRAARAAARCGATSTPARAGYGWSTSTSSAPAAVAR